MGKQTQCDLIIDHIKKYGKISSKEAVDLYGIMRLPSRICDLKNQGYLFKKETALGIDRRGNKTHWTEYSLMEEGDFY